MSRLIVGLGNPGKKYEGTRHNIGRDLISRLSFHHHLTWQEKFKGFYCSYILKGEKIIFLVPETYMNLSGESVILATNFFKIDLKDVLVLHDELDFPFGTIAFKRGGGLAGHNGLRSIASTFGNQEFDRMRLGIGRPQHGSVSNWVLTRYDGEQQIHLDTYLDSAAKALETYIEEGFKKVQKEFNKKDLTNC